MNSEKKGAAIGKALLSGPYLIWMAGFTLIPLAMILWYGLTDKGGGLTMANVIAIASADHAKALWLSLGLSLVSTVLCLLLAYPLAMILRGRGAAARRIHCIHIHPSHVDELPSENPGLADTAGEKRSD